MAATTCRRRLQIVFALLCLLLVVRMPAPWLVEESSVATVGLEAHLSVDAPHVHAAESVLSAIALDSLTPDSTIPLTETTARLIEYSILRL